jgi:hypothetical protein
MKIHQKFRYETQHEKKASLDHQTSLQMSSWNTCFYDVTTASSCNSLQKRMDEMKMHEDDEDVI